MAYNVISCKNSKETLEKTKTPILLYEFLRLKKVVKVRIHVAFANLAFCGSGIMVDFKDSQPDNPSTFLRQQ